jgi:hypothetical protein
MKKTLTMVLLSILTSAPVLANDIVDTVASNQSKEVLWQHISKLLVEPQSTTIKLPQLSGKTYQFKIISKSTTERGTVFFGNLVGEGKNQVSTSMLRLSDGKLSGILYFENKKGVLSRINNTYELKIESITNWRKGDDTFIDEKSDDSSHLRVNSQSVLKNKDVFYRVVSSNSTQSTIPLKSDKINILYIYDKTTVDNIVSAELNSELKYLVARDQLINIHEMVNKTFIDIQPNIQFDAQYKYIDFSFPRTVEKNFTEVFTGDFINSNINDVLIPLWADITVWITGNHDMSTSDWAGFAYIGMRYSDSGLFQESSTKGSGRVVINQHGVDWEVLAHEFGHVFGGRHDRTTNILKGDQEDNLDFMPNYGFINQNTGAYSLMAYPSTCISEHDVTCYSSNAFSSKELTENGKLQGKSVESDDAADMTSYLKVAISDWNSEDNLLQDIAVSYVGEGKFELTLANVADSYTLSRANCQDSSISSTVSPIEEVLITDENVILTIDGKDYENSCVAIYGVFEGGGILRSTRLGVVGNQTPKQWATFESIEFSTNGTSYSGGEDIVGEYFTLSNTLIVPGEVFESALVISDDSITNEQFKLSIPYLDEHMSYEISGDGEVRKLTISFNLSASEIKKLLKNLSKEENSSIDIFHALKTQRLPINISIVDKANEDYYEIPMFELWAEKGSDFTLYQQTISLQLTKDSDGDGVDDLFDDMPLNALESKDSDKDGVGDNSDAFPSDIYENTDSDEDGVGDNSDLDADNDGVNDLVDAFPYEASETLDTDLDGIGNNSDLDDDNDGVNDNLDAFPLDETETSDYDEDGIGDNKDQDDDNDGVNDNLDSYPNDSSKFEDSADVPTSTTDKSTGGSSSIFMLIATFLILLIRTKSNQNNK